MRKELSFQKFIEQSDLLEELKYDFNEKAELRHIETQGPFVFNYYKNVPERNSKRYQALGHFVYYVPVNTGYWEHWQTRSTLPLSLRSSQSKTNCKCEEC
uniref:Arb2 domain-containing protein n=1 Tax=Rhinolophus ferrumequinum TaxID=59479 RepID=A0A671EHK6_RHIFE